LQATEYESGVPVAAPTCTSTSALLYPSVSIAPESFSLFVWAIGAMPSTALIPSYTERIKIFIPLWLVSHSFLDCELKSDDSVSGKN
jgi:hypothetical protein